MAGSISLSLSQRFDKETYLPLNGGKVYFYAAGTTTPQNAFQDVSLSIPWPNPLTLDSGGNVPQLFFADGYIKFRINNADGVTQIEADYVLVVGPSSGGGSAPSVDPTSIIATGDIKFKYGTGVLSGFVRGNGRTIGSATSGAAERANSDAQSLFEFLWQNDANLAVSTGRGVSSSADWAANKTIVLPDFRGRVLAGMDDMGNSAAGRLTSTYFGTSAIVLGAAGGLESQTLTMAQLPAVAPTVATQPAFSYGRFNVNSLTGLGGGSSAITGYDANVPTAATITQNVVMAALGSGNAHPIAQPTMVITTYIKL